MEGWRAEERGKRREGEERIIGREESEGEGGGIEREGGGVVMDNGR